MRIVIPLVLVMAASAAEQLLERFPVRYSRHSPTDVMADWQAHPPVLDRSSPQAWLRSVLAALDVPAASQVLVFVQDSFQNSRIGPRTPRAIYWNDRTYVGWVQGGDIEVIASDPRLGVTFYRLALTGPERLASCLVCHAGAGMDAVPGMLLLSSFATDQGSQILRGSSVPVDYRTPIEQRWGGWYVTGHDAGARHRGNRFWVDRPDAGEAPVDGDRDLGRNLATLDGLVDMHPYPAPGSDIVSLLVLEHQVAAHNQLVRAAMTARVALCADDGYLVDRPLAPDTQALLHRLAAETLDMLLFRDEVPLSGRAIRGDPAFAAAFAAAAVRDPQGRSLRDLDLTDRIFRYRCSYLVHAPAFAALPDALRLAVLGGLRRVMRDERAGGGSHPWLGDDERQAIDGILRVTLTGY